MACVALAIPTFAETVDSVADVVTKFDSPPQPVKTKPPQYPHKLRSEGVAGMVVVTMVIDEGGKVLACQIAKSSNEAFNDPALEAVRTWTFVPAKVAGKAVRAKVSIPLKFEVEA
ncbi:MAG: energy transducer TonB [Candidatus Didemnitutus sp.]|nr:energy transducer TonB [Candidatus Didemnitutus sp.]